jgi:hypothetical protein
LLEAVVVDDSGVASIDYPEAKSSVKLAAVRVADGNRATQIPFMQPEAGTLRLGLPAERPSKLGFFVGYAGPLATRAVVRLGYYPGIPLLTNNDNGETKEMWAEVAGLRDYELDERNWADQVELWDSLGFNPDSTRGLFSRAHYNGANSGRLQQERIVVVPDEMSDLVQGPDVGASGSLLQVLAYTPDNLPSAAPQEISSTLQYGDLKFRFGPSIEVEAPVVFDDNPQHLLAAFEVTVVPRS